MSLKQLETHLGKNLFDGERKSQLSPLGAEVFSLAQSQLRHFDQTVQSIENIARTSNGLVRVASVPSVAVLVLPHILSRMTKLMPGVKIEFSDTDTRQVLDALANDKADIGIASGYHALNGTLATVLYEDQFGLVGAANHPLLTQSQTPSTAEVVTSAFIRNNLCESITNPAFTEALKHVNVTIRNNHSLINTISNSHWVSVLPESVIEHLPGSVAFRPISDLQDKREVWLYHRERSHFKDAVETCVRIIVDLDLGKKRTLRSAKAPVFE